MAGGFGGAVIKRGERITPGRKRKGLHGFSNNT